MDDATETETNLATTQTYTLTADDADKQVKLQVSFTDGFGGEETRESDPVPVPSNDASLSNLAIANAADDEAIPLNETFAADMTSYTANAAHAVTRITVTPTKNRVNATIAYLDGSDTDLTDAHTSPGHQVNLAVGDTTIKVKVTAEDATTTRTYTLTVTRAPADAPPTLVAQPYGAVVDRDRLVLTFDEDLDPGSVPSGTGGFTLEVRRGDPPQSVSTPPAVTEVTVSGKTATLTLSTEVLFGDTVTLTYAPPATDPLQDAEENKVAAFSDRPVNNSTVDDPPPKLVAQPDGAVVDRLLLVLTFDEDLDPGSVPSGTGGFTLELRRGDPPVPVSTPPAVTEVTVSGKTATLTLSTAVLFGDTVTLTYAPPATNPLQDAEENRVAAFSDQAVRNDTAQGPATAPGAPLNLQARPRDEEVALSWEPPSDTGNRPVERYELRYARGASVPSSTPWTDVGLSLDRLVTHLTNGRQHTFEVRAVNTANRTGPAARVRATPEVDAKRPVPAAPPAHPLRGRRPGADHLERAGLRRRLAHHPLRIPPRQGHLGTRQHPVDAVRPLDDARRECRRRRETDQRATLHLRGAGGGRSCGSGRAPDRHAPKRGRGQRTERAEEPARDLLRTLPEDGRRRGRGRHAALGPLVQRRQRPGHLPVPFRRRRVGARRHALGQHGRKPAGGACRPEALHHLHVRGAQNQPPGRKPGDPAPGPDSCLHRTVRQRLRAGHGARRRPLHHRRAPYGHEGR